HRRMGSWAHSFPCAREPMSPCAYDSSMAAPRVFSVSELIRQINLDLFKYNDISVEGEVTNYTRSSAGHHYFSLKDSRAQIRVVFFATNARFLRFRIENGLQLIVRGRLTVYEAKGEFQLNAVVVARAVAACEIPTISAVGHETDFTICDFVADFRAPTPSAAAEIVIRAKSEICTHIDHMTHRIHHIVEGRVRNYRHELRHLTSSD